MIIQVVQHNGAHPVTATPEHYRHLFVQRRHRIWHVDWGGWTLLGKRHDIFPEGFELRRSTLEAGTWSELRPRTIRVPFEKYLYWHEADGCGIEVVGPGFLQGCHMSIAVAESTKREERVYLVTTSEGHYIHSPNRQRRESIPAAQPAKPKPEEPNRIRKPLPHEGPFEAPAYSPEQVAEMAAIMNAPRPEGLKKRSGKSRHRPRL